MTVDILVGDCRTVLAALPAASFHTCVSSPPYYQQRDYDHPDQIGLEKSPEEFVTEMVAVFREVHRVLRDDGSLWVNLGDSYAQRSNGPVGNPRPEGRYNPHAEARRLNALRSNGPPAGLKHKDLIGIPWEVAFALRADGWYLRQEIIWHKPAPMPESVDDRCTKAHEHIFLLSKSPNYYFDAEAIRELASKNTHPRGPKNGNVSISAKTAKATKGVRNNASFSQAISSDVVEFRNKRSVWTVGAEPYAGAHFATFPPKLIEPCILAGSPAGGAVLDPFGGAGTTGLVAARLGRDATLIELNPEYAEMATGRLKKDLKAKVRGPEQTPDALPLFGGVLA